MGKRLGDDKFQSEQQLLLLIDVDPQLLCQSRPIVKLFGSPSFLWDELSNLTPISRHQLGLNPDEQHSRLWITRLIKVDHGKNYVSTKVFKLYKLKIVIKL